MKKLKTKVFFTIFFILTTFALSILLFGNVREYNREKSEIERVLERTVNFNGIDFDVEMMPPSLKFEKRDEIFIDYNVYTFLLDEDNEYYGLVNYSSESDNKTNEVINYVKKLTAMKNIKDKDVNILFSKYSYELDGNVLVVVDNSYQNARINYYLFYSLILFILIELAAIIITYYLTKWITKPVIDSFERERKFIGDASHELKTPIAVIMASADAYNQDKNKKWLDNIKSESDRMNKLVTDLLDLNNLENNQKTIKKEEVNLSKLVESSLLPYESLFFEHNLKFSYDIKPDIKYIVNDEKIKELISILIDNAIKYSKENGSVNKGDEIPIEERNRIFDRFYKVDKSRNRKSNNYGLGLSIAKKIVELHGGTIGVDCSGGTTTFTVKF